MKSTKYFFPLLSDFIKGSLKICYYKMGACQIAELVFLKTYFIEKNTFYWSKLLKLKDTKNQNFFSLVDKT